MAIKYYERYPQRWESPSQDYPQGAFKNLSALGEQDGSYLEKDWLNDYSGFFGALLRNAEMTPDGTIDTAQRSQFYDALMQLIDAELATKFDKSDLVNTSGQSTDKVMSQKAVTDHILLESTPIGTVQAFIGENAPNDKWLLCRGQAFSAESYPALAQLLPDLKIPDLRGVALRGLDANRGFDPNRALLSYQEDAMQKITGNISPSVDPSNIAADWLGVASWIGAFKNRSTGASAKITSTEIVSGHTGTDFDSSRVARSNTQNETVMKNVAVNFIIKAR